MKPALIGFNSRIKVCGLQKVKLANPAPCKPTISEALLNKFTWSSKGRSLKVIIEYPFFIRNFFRSSSFIIFLNLL